MSKLLEDLFERELKMYKETKRPTIHKDTYQFIKNCMLKYNEEKQKIEQLKNIYKNGKTTKTSN